jgi:predicted NUDIX family phosphoesterase
MATMDAQTAEEQVMVVPTQRFHDCGYFQGFTSESEKYLDQLLDATQTQYLPRAQMEQDPSFKQLIPYCIFQHVDHDGAVSVFQYTRGKGQGESRLHSKRSVGIGGHISTLDAGESSPYEEGMRRELEEEIIINTPYRQELVGLINDDETEVGKVHLGVVHLFTVESQDIAPNEDDICETGFRPVGEMLENLEGFETWSAICLKALFT